MEEFIFWATVGFLAALLARRVMPGENPAGRLGDLIAGVSGALLTGCLFKALSGLGINGWIISSCVAFLGATVLLFVIRAIGEQRAHRRRKRPRQISNDGETGSCHAIDVTCDRHHQGA